MGEGGRDLSNNSIKSEPNKNKKSSKEAVFGVLIKTTEVCERICQFAFTEQEWFDYNVIMLILMDRFRNPAAAKKVYHMLKSIGFIEEDIVEDGCLVELSQPKKSRKFMSFLKRKGVKSLDSLLENPRILDEINYDPDSEYLIEIDNDQIRVFKKLKGYKWRLSDLARFKCQTESEPRF